MTFNHLNIASVPLEESTLMLLTLPHPSRRELDLSRGPILEPKWKFLLSWDYMRSW